MFTTISKSYRKTFWELLKTDLVIFKKIFLGKLIDTACWVSVSLLSNAYVLPLLGMTKSYGQFIAVGTIVTLSFLSNFEFSSQFLADLEGEKTITGLLILPIPTWLIFLEMGCFYAIEAACLSLPIIPLAKLVLQHNFDLSSLSMLKAVVAFASLHLFTAAFALFITSLVKSMQHIMQVWNRALFPLWTFGGSFFSWKTLFKLSPKLAYCNLLNPLVYASEAIHGAFLGQGDYLPFWPCCFVLWVMTIGFSSLGISLFKKRLDFV